jgi:hypothetical protein
VFVGCGYAAPNKHSNIIFPDRFYINIMIHPITRSVILLGLQFGLLACAGTKPSPEPGKTTDRPGTTNQPVEISGVIFSASDVSGYPDVPLPDQIILAVPLGKAEETLGAGANRLEDRKLRFLKVKVSGADPPVNMTLSDPSGKYSLLLPPGDYVLCVLESETTPPSLPATTRGCGRAEVAPGESKHIDISSGFGEILLQPR